MSPFAAVTAATSVVASVMAALRSVSSSLLFALTAARRLRSPSSRRMIVRFTAVTASATIAAEPSIKNAEIELLHFCAAVFFCREALPARRIRRMLSVERLIKSEKIMKNFL